jgi:hypothetical protein
MHHNHRKRSPWLWFSLRSSLPPSLQPPLQLLCQIRYRSISDFSVNKETTACKGSDVAWMHVNVQPNKETAHEIAGENQGVKSLCMLMDEEIKETIKIGNHYMDGLFAWEPGGRKGMCFFPWKSGWISMLTVAALHEILC